jgi:hypothetical protein
MIRSTLDEKEKLLARNTDQGIIQAQSVEEIEQELQQKLALLGISLGERLVTSEKVRPQSGHRATQPLAQFDDRRTTLLDIGDLRQSLRQQVRIAEVKREIESMLRRLFITGPAPTGQTQELEVRAAALLLPYCQEYIPDFPGEVRPSEFALDLNLQDIIDLHADYSDYTTEELEETIEQYAMQVVQALLAHPLIPQQDARRIGSDLKTTALKDMRGTAIYSTTDAQFLEEMFKEHRLLDQSGENGLIAILISAKKWNKIDSESLFTGAVQCTLAAMAKRRGIPSIVLRGQGEDQPVAYLLSEYIMHALEQPLAQVVKFIEDFLQVTQQVINSAPEDFILQISQHYLPRLKQVFQHNIPEAFDRFIETFRREFQNSQKSLRNKIFFLKRIGDLCEVAFYVHEAIKQLESPSGEVYAREKLDEGIRHFTSRNNIPIGESDDILAQKNVLAECLLFTLKQRWGNYDAQTLRPHFVSKMMNETLFFIDSLRRVFDHPYARGRASSGNDYETWEESVAECSQGFLRLLFGRTLSDIERYRFEKLYRRLIEKHLAFFDLQGPTLLGAAEFKMERYSKAKTPEDNLKEHFMFFFTALYQALLNFDSVGAEFDESPNTRNLLRQVDLDNKSTRTPLSLSAEAVQARVFLAQSDLPISDYALEALSAVVTADGKDKVTLLQALRASLELASKARILEEIQAIKPFLQNIRQRLSLILLLNEQEKEQWRGSISNSLNELAEVEPIAISSYAIILGSVDDWDISTERISEEWKNPETSILRLQQLLCITLLQHGQEKLQQLVDSYQTWVRTSGLPNESARKRALEKRADGLCQFAARGVISLALLRYLLLLVEYVQLSYEITNWSIPEAYVLEDLLLVETPLKRIKQIEAILSMRDLGQLQSLVVKFSDILLDRYKQSASGYVYYTDEEKFMMEKRRQRFDKLSRRSVWRARTDWLVFSVIRLLVRVLKSRSRIEQREF